MTRQHRDPRAPDRYLIVAGVGKGGTTSLYHYLGAHPEVCPSSVKETYFFDRRRLGDAPPRPEDYLRYFPYAARHRVAMEATPTYYYGGESTVRALLDTLADVRVVVSFRDPVSRALSFFRYRKSRLELPRGMSFEQYVDRCRAASPAAIAAGEETVYSALHTGRYVDHIGPWVERLGDRLRIVFFEDLRTDAAGLVAGLLRWSGLDPCLLPAGDYVTHNPTRLYRRASVHRAALWVSDRMDASLNRHPRWKRALTRAYFRLNEVWPDDDLSAETVLRLEQEFSAPNARLRSVLEELGYRDLPPWLQPSADPSAQPPEYVIARGTVET